MRSARLVAAAVLTVAVAVAALLVVAHVAVSMRNPVPAPLTPQRRWKTRLYAPASYSFPQFVAEIVLPDGYSMQILVDRVNMIRRSSPQIMLDSVSDDPLGNPPGHSVPFIDETCDSEKLGYPTDFERKADGWSVVCRGVNYEGDPEISVIRRLRQNGYEAQCRVLFSMRPLNSFREDSVEPQDWWSRLGNPSTSRVNDALAICDTVKLRPVREEETEDVWNGHEWLRPNQDHVLVKAPE